MLLTFKVIYRSVILTSMSWGLISYECKWNCINCNKPIPLLLHPTVDTGPLTLAKSPWSLQRRLRCLLLASSWASVDDQSGLDIHSTCEYPPFSPGALPPLFPVQVNALLSWVLSYFLDENWEAHRPQNGAVLPLFLHSSQNPHEGTSTACLCASSTCRNYRAGQGDRCLHSTNLSLFLKKDLMHVNPYQMMPGDILHYRWGCIRVLLRHSKLKDLETAFLLREIRVLRSPHLSGHIYSKNI